VFTPAIALLSLIGLFAVIAECASSQWAAIYVSDDLGGGGTAGALAFACFAGAMTAGRLGGDRIVNRIGRRAFFTTVPLLAVAGIVVGVALAAPWAAFLGFALVGAGLSCVTPTVYGTAGVLPGREGQDPGPAIATISVVTWPGFLAAPLIVGTLCGAASLRVALLMIGLAAALIPLLATRLRLR
jgi:MFS family permease